MTAASSKHSTRRRRKLRIEWTRPALALPESVRKELLSRLNRLHRYFPEMKTWIRIGITLAYDGFVVPSLQGFFTLRLHVRKNSDGTWKYPTYFTLAHELMHLTQFGKWTIPMTERATDIYTLARLPAEFIDEAPDYLAVPKELRKTWTQKHSRIAHQLAREALVKRSHGVRRYAKWWEEEFARTNGTIFSGQPLATEQ